MTFQVEQSVPICLALSAAGGAIEVLATAVLAYQDAREKAGHKWKRIARYGALGLNIFLQVTSSMIGNLFATWFGPVSLVGPVFLSSQLLANMVVFGILLGLEKFTKDMKIGTWVVVIAVILLPIVGPTAQENQDVGALLEMWYSLAWLGILLVGMTVSLISLVVLNVAALPEWKAIVLLLLARATSFTVNLTVSKVMIMNVSPLVLGVAIFLKIASGGIITYALVVQSTAVTQAKFIPLNASALIIVNALTGMIIWQDWKVVGNWVGYVCVFVQLVLGNYLLLGDVELLSPDNTQYGRAKSVYIAKDFEHAVAAGDLFTIDESESQEMELNEDDLSDSGKYTSMEDASPSPSDDAPVKRDRRRRMSTPQEAWSSIYGLDRKDGPRRRTTIFVMDTMSVDDLERTESGKPLV